MASSVSELLRMSQAELDELFRASKAGPIPAGEGRGTAIVAPGTPFADLAAKVAHQVAWQGKVFDPEAGVLRNKITPAGVQDIVAKVYEGVSWFDGGACTVLDYSATSFVAQAIRDEIRQIGPDFYLGIVYIGDRKTINFALEFGPAGKTQTAWQRVSAKLLGLFRRGRA